MLAIDRRDGGQTLELHAKRTQGSAQHMSM